MSLIFVDTEADGPCPGKGVMTEFGAVELESRQTFHGVLWEAEPDPQNPAMPRRTGKGFDQVAVFTQFEQWLKQFPRPYVFVSDNPAFDFMWICIGFHETLGHNPFGFSARRIGDFYAGLCGDFKSANRWKRLRITTHDHNPVNDAMGNAEAFARILRGER